LSTLLLNHFRYHLKLSQVSLDEHAIHGYSAPASSNSAKSFFFVSSSRPKRSTRLLNSPLNSYPRAVYSYKKVKTVSPNKSQLDGTVPEVNVFVLTIQGVVWVIIDYVQIVTILGKQGLGYVPNLSSVLIWSPEAPNGVVGPP
jgi:hypothetical protein